ncbi:ribosomal protein L36e [Aspergillus luchuensis]|uniref:Ribosomal protein L36e n=1 Tax=Aspergillus kawachii TaxID=1069201 RepID=A0A146FK19_ASPKA|nr:ribosomal protein L36e [Aspergillus luchuensis]
MAEVYLNGNSSSPSYDYRYSHQPWNVVTQTVCLVLSTGFVAMRLYSKIHITKAPGWEDCFVGISLEADRHGIGVHQWEVDPHDLSDFAKLINASQVLYGPLIFLTKLSIFLFYLRVFAPSPKCNQWWFIQILMGLNFFFYLADTIVKIFECTPRARIWDKAVPGRCIDAAIPVLVTSIVNVVSDIMMLLMPIRCVWRLQITLRKKVGITAIFAAGLLTAEITSGIIASSLPALPSFYRHISQKAKTLVRSISTASLTTFKRRLPSTGNGSGARQSVSHLSWHPSSDPGRSELVRSGSDWEMGEIGLFHGTFFMTTTGTTEGDGEKGDGILKTVQVEIESGPALKEYE